LLRRLTYCFSIALGLSLLLFALFPRQTCLQLASWKFSSLVKKEWGGKLVSGDLSWSKGKLHLKDAHISSESFDIRIGSGSVALNKELTLEDVNVHLFSSKGTNFDKVSSFLLQSSFKTTMKSCTLYLEAKEAPTQKVGFAFSPGQCTFFFENQSPLHLFCSINDSKQTTFKTRFEFRKVGALSTFARYFLAGKVSQNIADWHFSQGELAGDLEVVMEQKKCLGLKGKLHIQDMQGKNPSSILSCHIENASSTFDFDFAKRQLSAYNCDIILKNGSLCSIGARKERWQGLWDLFLAEANLGIKEGTVTKSKILANFFGMEGNIELDMRAPDIFLKMDFLGSGQAVKDKCPEALRAAFGQAFGQDQFKLKVSCVKNIAGIELQGDLTVKTPQNNDHKLFFGCHFDQEDLKHPRQIISLLNVKEHLWLEKPIGWFQARHFPLEKFFSPFLFVGKNLHLSGLIDFEGTFDENLLAFFYSGKNCYLDSPHFSMRCDAINQSCLSQNTACHYIDLKTWDHAGVLPMRQATYEQKSHQFTLTNSSMVAYFSKNNIHIKEIDTQFENLKFCGEVHLEKQKEALDLWIKTAALEGDLDAASHFLKKCIPKFSFSLPQEGLEGRVRSSQDGVALHFLFDSKPNGARAKLVDASVVGTILASYDSDYFKFSDYRVCFDYDLKRNKLAFSKGEGTFSCNSLCYSVETPLISFHDFPEPQFALEMSVKNGTKELFHLLGRTEKREGKRDIIIEGNQFKLTAIQEAGRLVVDKFNVGSVHGKADFSLVDDVLKVSNFEVNSSELGVLNFTGEYDAKKTIFKAEVPRLNLDLNKLFFNSSLPESLKKWGSTWHPRGMLSGELNLVFDFSTKTFLAKSVSSFSNLGLSEIEFGDGKNLQLQFSSKEGFTVEGLEVSLPGYEGLYTLRKLHYNLESQKIKFDAFDFSLHKDEIPILSSLAMRLFPQIPEEMIDWVKTLKGQEPIEGKISLEMYPGKVWAYLSLKDGVYQLFDKKHDIRNFALTVTPEGVELGADSFIHDTPYFFCLYSPGFSLEEGSAFFKENIGSMNAIKADWKREGRQIQLKEIEGKCFGIEAHLKEKQKNILNGYLLIDCQQCSSIFSIAIREKINRFSLGDGYSLQGDFAYSFNEGSCAFIGKLLGSNFSVGKMRLGSMRADLVFSDHLIEIDNFAILDWGGKMEIPKLRCHKQNERWKLQIPELRMEDVRLSRIKEVTSETTRKSKKSYFKHLNIESFVANGIEGILGDDSSFKGSGDLKFTNLNRKTFFSNILFLPAELTGRLGLDLSLLVPAQGQVRYEIGGGRINLIKFKKMYSEGKRSRFYLAEGHQPFIDFKGNLNLKVKMKQYNLLMKFAELFVVTVKGNIFKPTYSFTNQSGDSLDNLDEE
jgi:hypothetical protein